MKVLKAHNITASIPKEIMPISKLYPSIRWGYYEVDFKKIKDSIIDNGLKYPIVVWHTTVAHWEEWIRHSTEHIQPIQYGLINPNQAVYIIMCGNNRVQAAIELGYNHIEIIRFTDKSMCSDWCNKMRKDWKNNEYT